MAATKRVLIQRSIKKWEGVLNGKYEDGSSDCPLCKAYMEQEGKDVCEGCPIMEDSGRDSCRNTPYHAWHRHQYEYHMSARRQSPTHPGCDESAYRTVVCDECRDLVRQEIYYLKQLLEKYTQRRNDRAEGRAA